MDYVKLIIKRKVFEILNGFVKIYSITFSLTNEILKMFNYPHNIYRLYKERYDRLSSHCPVTS